MGGGQSILIAAIHQSCLVDLFVICELLHAQNGYHCSVTVTIVSQLHVHCMFSIVCQCG